MTGCEKLIYSYLTRRVLKEMTNKIGLYAFLPLFSVTFASFRLGELFWIHFAAARRHGRRQFQGTANFGKIPRLASSWNCLDDPCFPLVKTRSMNIFFAFHWCFVGHYSQLILSKIDCFPNDVTMATPMATTGNSFRWSCATRSFCRTVNCHQMFAQNNANGAANH